MSKINLKAFSGKIYTYLSPYLNEYVANEISKEAFVQMMNEGILSFDSLKTKENKILTFCPASNFIIYSGHSCANGSVKRMFTRNWFKVRYEIIDYNKGKV